MLLILTPSATTATLDVTPPLISYTVDAITGANGWYRGSTHGSFVVVRWSIADPDSLITSSVGCDPALRIDSPNMGTTRTCTATSDGGTTSVTTKIIKIDAEAPTGVAAAPSRGADFNGWYNHPVGISWHGSDVTAGIATCTSLVFPAPGVSADAIRGACTDNAGNSSSTVLALQYDATPPTIGALSVGSHDGENVLRWKSSSAADVAVVDRVARGSRRKRVVFHAAARAYADTRIRDGVEYRYLVRTFDQAGNGSAVASLLALPKALTLAKLAYVPRTAGAPVLHWPRTPGASYYHLQLFSYGRRVLAVWPLKTKLGLRWQWWWNGQRYRLSPATYSWYVWAGFGPRAAARYKLLGSAAFAVPRTHG